LRLDPDYPKVFRFFPELITDSVLEYRGYVFILPWAGFLAWILPGQAAWFLIGWWAVCAWKQAGYYKTNIAFWERCFKESPRKMRVRTNYIEKLISDVWRRYQSNAPGSGWERFEPEITRLMKLMDDVCNEGRR
jgi:hypothetical protein